MFVLLPCSCAIVPVHAHAPPSHSRFSPTTAFLCFFLCCSTFYFQLCTFYFLGFRLKVNVVAFDYTGFGLHEGSPSESACYDDARAVYGTATRPSTPTAATTRARPSQTRFIVSRAQRG